MAEEVNAHVTNADSIGKEVRDRLERRGGKLDEISGQLERIDDQLEILETQLEGLEDLDKKIDELRQRIEQIEQTKARAEREALEDLKSELGAQLQEKKEEYQRRLGEVLDDYRNSVETLKERFVDTISGREEQFGQIEAEFAATDENRRGCVDATLSTGEAATDNHDARLEAVIESRNAFMSAIDEFVGDREDTAATIDSLQTPVPGIREGAQIVVPFWVVGVEIDGREELRVLPVQNRSDPSGTLERASPYLEYLEEHPTHSYGEMTDAVHAHVSRDEVRDDLARREGEFADPGFLADQDVAMERFVDALREYELDGRGADGAGSTGPEPETESAGRQEVPADG